MWLDIDPPGRRASRIRVECRAGTPFGAITAAVGLISGPWWCGPHALTADAIAGTASLPHAALVTPQPGVAGPLWPGPRLVSVAGADAGHVVPLGEVTPLGTSAADLAPRGWQDPSLDPHHATAELASPTALLLTDAGSTNGIRSWDEAYPQRWSARRRRLRLAPGDCAALGETVVQFRSPSLASGFPFGGLTWLDPLASLDHPLLLDSTARLTRDEASARAGRVTMWPQRWWNARLRITGPHRIGVARAVILARGRQLPFTSPLAEPWQSLLPPADAHDRPVQWDGSRGEALDTELVTLHTSARGAMLSRGRDSLVIPLCAVAADVAETIARAFVSTTRPLPPLMTRGDLPAGPGVGVGADDSSSHDGVWSLPESRSWIVLVAGAPGTGKSTAIASILAGIATNADGREWENFVISPEPHMPVAADDATTCLRPADVGARLEELITGSSRRVLLAVDNAHLLDAAALRVIYDTVRRRDAHVSAVLTAERAPGTFPPELIARADALICLRTESPDGSRDFIGVADAATLPVGQPGLAYVRDKTGRRLIRIALPVTDPSASARII